MPIIAWNDMLATGTERIDSQHKQLVGIINEFIHDQNDSTDQDKMKSVLIRLRAYTHEHFSDEETLMGEVGYPARETHKAEHRRMTEEVEARLNAAAAGELNARDLRIFLKTWLVDHILGWDFKIVEHIKAPPVG